jgi:Predicted phosphoesterase
MFYENILQKIKKQLIMTQNALESRDRDERRGQTMKKVAIISDIHGNLTAFQQVIKDAEKQRVDEYWFLGDLLMPGPGAESILELLNQINTTHFIRGNWDDFLFENILGISKDYINEPQTTYMVELIKYVKSHLDSKYVQQVQQWPISKNIHF